MKHRILELAKESGYVYHVGGTVPYFEFSNNQLEKFAQLIVRECINKIETHQIPVGNSAAGEMACEWTYAALKEIRDEIKQHFGVES
jgi:hypothetical protein